MILKKPYAFLIKHFKMIHLIITFLLGIIAYKFLDIVNFYRSYVANNYKTSIILNLSNTYTPKYLFICTLLVIALSTAVFILLRHKNKPNKLYIFINIYYIILFVFLFYLSFLFSSFEEALLSASLSRRIRDIVIIYYIPQWIFVIITLLRAIGFNIKKFNFKDDLQQMDYSYEDAEEFEFNVNFDSSKVQRKVHRYFRELIYYIKENRFFVICICTILVIVLGWFGIKNMHGNYDRSYGMGKDFSYGKLTLNIKDSIVTNLDYNGKVINDDYYFVVVNLNIKNNSGTTVAMDYNNLKLKISGDVYNPENEYLNNFLDFTNPKLPKSIAHKTDKIYGIVYKVKKGDINKSKKLIINNGTVYDKGEYLTKNIYVSLKSKMYDEISNKGKYILNEEVSLKDSLLKESIIKISNYQLTNKYQYKYSKCQKDICKEYDDLITIPASSGRSGNTLLILESFLKLDESIEYVKNYNSLSSFADNFMKIEYYIDKYYVEKPINVTPQNKENIIALEVSSKIASASVINAIITIRDKEYIINLKS